MKTIIISFFISLVAVPALAVAADDPQMGGDILTLQHEWARIKYRVTDEKAQLEQMDQLIERASAITQKYPGHAEPLIWEAIITSTQAGNKGGFSALRLAKKARALLEQAEKIDPTALDGSVYTSLGALYYQVPGWPIGFGNSKKARANLEKALSINPDGIDPNFFYGDFLIDQKEYEKAMTVLHHAQEAAGRPERPLADSGRRGEIQAALAKAQDKLN